MKRKYLILFSLSGLVLASDQFTKHFILKFLSFGERIPVIGSFLSLTFAKNNGFAFGLLQKAPQPLQEVFFIGIPVFALVLIVLIFIKLRDDQMLTSVALTSILGGAVGNLIDRLQYGYVVDFVEIRLGKNVSLPAFNLADCAILCGVAIMFVSTLHQERMLRGVA